MSPLHKSILQEKMEQTDWKDIYDEYYVEPMEDERISQEYKYEVEGKFYPTIEAAANDNNIPLSTLIDSFLSKRKNPRHSLKFKKH